MTHLHPRLRQFLTLAALMFCVTAARAQIIFTFTGHIDGDCQMLGYTTGNFPTGDVTFTVVLNSVANNGDSFFHDGSGGESANTSFWAYEDDTQDRLFTSVAGTGLAGGLSTLTGFYPFSDFIVSGGNSMRIYVSSDNSENKNIGPTINDGTQLFTFDATFTIDPLDGRSFPVLSSYSDPVAYLTSNGLLGTYNLFSSVDVTLTDVNGTMVEFDITSVNISAIPEPTTCAAIFGFAALGVIGAREVKRRKAA